MQKVEEQWLRACSLGPRGVGRDYKTSVLRLASAAAADLQDGIRTYCLLKFKAQKCQAEGRVVPRRAAWEDW